MNRGEKDCGAFLRHGMTWIKGPDGKKKLDKLPIRVAVIKHWDNVQWSSEKIIDYTGLLYGGWGFAVECKQFWYKCNMIERWFFSEISDRQRSLLDTYVRVGGEAWLWLRFHTEKNENRHRNDATFFVPWREWMVFEELHDHKSVNMEELCAHFPEYTLVYQAGGTWWRQEDQVDGEMIAQPLLAKRPIVTVMEELRDRIADFREREEECLIYQLS